MEDVELDKLRKRVSEKLALDGFVEGKAGQLFIKWINGEISRCTEELIKQEYDEQPMKTVALRAELRAYATIANRMSITQAHGSRAKQMIKDSGEKTAEELEDLRSPEDIQNESK